MRLLAPLLLLHELIRGGAEVRARDRSEREEAAEREEIGGGETSGDWVGFHPGRFCLAAGTRKRVRRGRGVVLLADLWIPGAARPTCHRAI